MVQFNIVSSKLPQGADLPLFVNGVQIPFSGLGVTDAAYLNIRSHEKEALQEALTKGFLTIEVNVVEVSTVGDYPTAFGPKPTEGLPQPSKDEAFVPEIQGDWNSAPETLGAAINELASRLRQLEDAIKGVGNSHEGILSKVEDLSDSVKLLEDALK